MTYSIRLIILVPLICTALMISLPTCAALYEISVEGWEDFSTLSGTFEITDLNNDGFISNFDPGELTNFSLVFAYQGGFPFVFEDPISYFFALDPTTQDPLVVQILVEKGGFPPGTLMLSWSLVDGLFGSRLGAEHQFISQTNLGTMFSDISLSIPTISRINAVPLPAAIWLFSSALIGLIGFGKRKKLPSFPPQIP